MNKTFKVKRNSSGQTVATSELAKSHSSVSVKIMSALGLLAVAATAQAGTINSPEWVDIGSNNTVSNASTSTTTRPALEYVIGDNNSVSGSAELRYTSLDLGELKADGTEVTRADIGKRIINADGSVATGQLGALSIGANNSTNGGQNISIGYNNDNSAVKAEAQLIIGSDNTVTGYSDANLARKIEIAKAAGVELTLESAQLDNEGTIIIGDENIVELSKSMVLIAHNGSISGTAQNAVGIGDETTIKSSNQAVTIGRKTLAENSHGAVAIGSTATVKDAYGGVSLGVAALTDTANGVALGSFSQAHRAAISETAVTTFGEGAQVSANQVYALSIANDQDKADIAATVKGSYGAVSVGNDTATRQITNVAAGTADSDAVNVSQLQATNAVVEKHEGDINQLQIDVKAAKTELKAGDNVNVTEVTGSNGQSVYTVSSKDVDYRSVAGSDAVSIVTGSTTKIDGTTVTEQIVDLSSTTKESLAKADTALQNIVAGDNISVVKNGDTVTVATTPDVKHNSVTFGGTVYISGDTVNMGGNKVTNVAPGEVSSTSTDAVNGSQLYQTNQNVANLNNKVDNVFGALQGDIDKVRKDMSAGIAGVNAAVSIPQAHRAGQSSIGAGVGYFGGQSALAIGASTVSDTGRWTVKGQVNLNTRGDVGAGAGVAYNF